MGRKADAFHCTGKLWEHFPYVSHTSITFACSTSSMGMIRDVYCSILHRFPISADIIFSSPIDSPYDYFINFNLHD